MDYSKFQDEKTNLEEITKYTPIIKLKNKKKFSTKLIIYEEPFHTPIGYGKYYDYTVNEINDFTDKIDKMKLNDYKLAFSEPSDLSKFNRKSRTLEELIKEREQFTNGKLNLITIS